MPKIFKPPASQSVGGSVPLASQKAGGSARKVEHLLQRFPPARDAVNPAHFRTDSALGHTLLVAIGHPPPLSDFLILAHGFHIGVEIVARPGIRSIIDLLS